jgi:hypothetical protein
MIVLKGEGGCIVGEDSFKGFTLYSINQDTGEQIEIGGIQDVTFTPSYEEINEKDNTYFNFLNREATFSISNVKMFPDKLGKFHYMKTHSKNKRTRKKYSKIYDEMYAKLFTRFFIGI